MKKGQATATTNAVSKETQDFFDILHRGGQYRFLQNLNALVNGQEKRRSVWFKTSEPVTIPTKWTQGERSNIFFGVNPSTRLRNAYQGSVNREIAALSCLYAEFDGKDFAEPSTDEIEVIYQALRDAALADGVTLHELGEVALRREAEGQAKSDKFATDPETYKALALEQVKRAYVPASVIVASGGGYQAYWLLTEPLVLQNDEDRDRAKSIQKSWVAYVGGDKSVHDLRRILRVPGTYNHKPRYAPNFPEVTFTEYDLQLQYELPHLVQLLPVPDPVPAVTSPHHPLRAATENSEDRIITRFNEDNDIADLLKERGWTRCRNGRLSRPGQPDSAGIWVTPEGKICIHSSSDPLYNIECHALDCFDVVQILDYKRNFKAAYEAVKRSMGLWQEQTIRAAPAETTVYTNGHNKHSTLKKKPDDAEAAGDDTDETDEEDNDETDEEDNDESDNDRGGDASINLANAETLIERIKEIAENNSLDAEQKIEEVRVLASLIGRITRVEQQRVEEALVKVLGWKKTNAKQFIANVRQDAKETNRQNADRTDSLIDHDEYPAWPYTVRDGQTIFLQMKISQDGTQRIVATVAADFWAEIYEQSIVEGGEKIFKVRGVAIRNGEFMTEVSGRDFSDTGKLKALLEVAAGPKDPIMAGMEKHMGPAIKLFTQSEIMTKHRFHRTGWHDGKFLIHGREQETTEIVVPRKLPYEVTTQADLALGLTAWESSILSMTGQQGTIIYAALLQAPLAYLTDWRDERYAVFAKGSTGTLKTSNLQIAMCIWGPQFKMDQMLIKWGEGATRNAMMAMATHVCDLPILMDNYKPTTGGGLHDFTNVIHNILEGGEKDRLQRSSVLIETRPIHTWPVCTGEDVPNGDAASLARILVIKSNWEAGREYLTQAQDRSDHLCAIGSVWLDWLESDAAKTTIAEYASKFRGYRTYWAEYISVNAKNMVNVLRVATNLATNQLTWEIVCEHPVLGPIAQKYEQEHMEGLCKVAQDMSDYTQTAIEWQRFVMAIQEMITAGQAIIVQNKKHTVISSDRHLVIGAKAKNGGVFIYPDIARGMVDKLLGKHVLGSVSNNTLYDQLNKAGKIGDKDPGRMTTVKRIDGKATRVLHLIEGVLDDRHAALEVDDDALANGPLE